MKKLTYKLLTALILFPILLNACAPKGEDASDPTPQPDSTPSAVTTPQVGESMSISKDITLDPAKTTDADSLMVSQYIYEGLVRLDANGEVQPAIAESWVISDDQLDYIFEIRPDAKFSDGSLITTDIIVDNFNRWFDPQSPLHGDGNYPTWLEVFLAFNGERDAENRAKSLVNGIQKVDGNTVLIHLTRPVPNMLELIANPAFAILHPDSLSASGYGTSDSNIISSGAYIVSSWTDEGLTLTSNSEYWNPTSGEIKFVWK